MASLSGRRLYWGSGYRTAWIVLAAGIILSIATWFFVQSVVERDARARFQAATFAIAAEAQRRIGSYAGMLYGLQGLFQAEPTLSRAAFERYVYSLNLPLRFPGAHSVSYARLVPAAAKAEFERQMRRDPELIRREAANVVIKPAGARPEYLVVTYIEPLRVNKAALGFDVASDLQRADVVERARDSGMPTLSGHIALAVDPTRSTQGVVMRLALYRKDMFAPDIERRRAAFSGLVNVTILVEELAQYVLYGEDGQKFRLSIHDAGAIDADPRPAPEQLYSNAASRPPQAGAVVEDVRSIEVGQRRWELKFSAPQKDFFRAADHVLPWAAFAAVLVASLLLSGLIHSLAGSRQRARTLAAQITAELSESQTRLIEEQRRTQELIEVLPNPVFYKGRDGRYLGVNRAWEKFFGLSRKEFIGKTVHELYPGNPDIADRLHADDQALWDHPGTQSYETSITTPDGQRHDAVYYKATFAHTDGSVAGLVCNIVDISERKWTEKKLRDSHESLNSLLNSMVEGAYGVDTTGNCTFVNRSCLQMLGYQNSAELLGKHVHTVMHHSHADGSPYPASECKVYRAYQTGQTINVSDEVFWRQDGSSFPVEYWSRPILVDGVAVGAILTFIDITERKQAQEIQARLAAIVASSNDAIVSRGLDDKILSWNAGAERLFGYTTDEAIGQTVEMIFPPDRNEEIARNRALLAQGIPVLDLETERIAKGGRRIAVSLSQSPVKDEQGSITSIALIFRDITERKEREARYRAMFENAAVGITRVDLNAVLVDVNQKFCDMLGYTRDELIGKAIRDITHPDDYGRGAQQRGQVIKGETSDAASEKRFVRKDGAIMWVRRSLSIVRDGAGNPQYIISVVEDITERKHAEEIIHHLAKYDELTGLPNRSMFHDRLHHALAQVQRHARPLAILFIDLDRFKNINDTLGHEAGDQVLREVAQRLLGCLRDSDTVGRLGGDEFVVLIEELPRLPDVAAVAQKILDAVARPFVLAAQEYHIGASIGISTCPEDGNDPQTLLKHADAAMYRAKEQGRNNYQFYSAQIERPGSPVANTE